jgi:inner membrane protein
LVRKRLTFTSVWFFAALGYGTHGLLDACTTYGTQLLWPLTNARFAWHNVSVIDPLLTLPLLIFLVMSAARRQPRIAVYGFCWALCYLGFGLVQHQRALSAAEQIVSSRQHDAIRLEVKPGFANLLVWKALYEYEDRYYVDAVRVGITPTYFPGESAAKFNAARDFSFLTPTSQQAKDIERFRWFSDDWLALDDKDAAMIVDMRYSQIPNAIKGLWGIKVLPGKAETEHVEWTVQREIGAEELSLFWAQLMGGDAVPLPQPW